MALAGIGTSMARILPITINKIDCLDKFIALYRRAGFPVKAIVRLTKTDWP
jgi:hypothetical protein